MSSRILLSRVVWCLVLATSCSHAARARRARARLALNSPPPAPAVYLAPTPYPHSVPGAPPSQRYSSPGPADGDALLGIGEDEGIEEEGDEIEPPDPAVASTPSGALLLFGGEGHKTFLGCLNCSEYSSASVFNEYGEFGSPYRSKSIRNDYGEFGSAYSSKSACNDYASDPPVIVDKKGRYYGRLTVNEYRDQTRLGWAVAWLTAVCKH